jgi:hypothetical protein
MTIRWMCTLGLVVCGTMVPACGSSDQPPAGDGVESDSGGSSDAVADHVQTLGDAGAGDVVVAEAEPDAAAGPDASADDDSAQADAVAPDTADAGAPDTTRPPPPDTGAVDAPADCGHIKCDCTFNGKKLYGKYKVVDAFGDFKVREVTAFADLDVQKVDAFADSCGQWQLDDFPDFTVEIVDAFEDFSIRYVDAFPGLP